MTYLTYLVIGLALLGCVAVASSRRRVESRPACPNCGAALPSFETDRCPSCLLWQPPDPDKPQHVWHRYRTTLGILLIVLPVFVFLLAPLLIRETFAPLEPPSAVFTGIPTALPPLPPALRGLTPGQIAQLRALGYLPSPWGTTMPVTTAPSRRASLSPAVIKALRAAGYLSADQNPEPEVSDADEITDETAPASEGGV